MHKLIVSALAACAFIGGAARVQSQISVTVDPSQNWIGYMNVSLISGSYEFGGAWGTADLRAGFVGTNLLVLSPCTNVWETTNTYWVQADKVTPNQQMDANFYVQNDALANTSLTFSGFCLTNTLELNQEPHTGLFYSTVAFIKLFDTSFNLIGSQEAICDGGTPFSVNMSTVGAAHVQYGFETIGPDADPATVASLGNVAIQAAVADPRVGLLASQGAVVGQNVTFTASPAGTGPFSYKWVHGVTTLTNDGVKYSGATNVSLTISNASLADAGTYTITVKNVLGSANTSATLGVQPLSVAQTNMLFDPSFESGVLSPSGSFGWANFNGAVFQNSTNDYFNSTTPISVLDGTNVIQTYATGANSYNGVYQDVPASPGQILTVDAWFYTSSLDQISGGNNCFLEVHFMDAANNVLLDYRSLIIDTNFPSNTWVNLKATNIFAADFVTPRGTAPYLKAPPNTAKVRTQATYFAPSTNGGSVYVDDFNLRLQSPVVGAVLNGSSIKLSFATLFGPTYKVLFKNHLSDATWQQLTTVVGDGTTKAVSDPLGSATRFYTINTQ